MLKNYLYSVFGFWIFGIFITVFEALNILIHLLIYHYHIFKKFAELSLKQTLSSLLVFDHS
jgi:hypothetical protein